MCIRDSVYAVEPGVIDKKEWIGATSIRIGDKRYCHVIPYSEKFLHGKYYIRFGRDPETDEIIDKVYVVDDPTLDRQTKKDGRWIYPIHLPIGQIERNHVHFEKIEGSENPLKIPGVGVPPATEYGLYPHPTQTMPPVVYEPEFRVDETSGTAAVYLSTSAIYGKVDIVTKTSNRYDLRPATCIPYRMEYKIINTTTKESFGPFSSFRFDRVYSRANLKNLYAFDKDRMTVVKIRATDPPTKFYCVNTFQEGGEYQYWNTKQRIDKNPDVDARINAEAKFKDGKYRTIVAAYNIAGFGGDTTTWKGAIKKEILIDNFLPYVERVTVSQAGVKYSAHWSTYPVQRYDYYEDKFYTEIPSFIKQVDEPCLPGVVAIEVVFSEIMDTSVSPNVNVTFPDGTSQGVTGNWLDNKRWSGSITVSEGLNGEAQIEISNAVDIAGSPMDGNPSTIAARDPENPEAWINAELPPDTTHRFEVGDDLEGPEFIKPPNVTAIYTGNAEGVTFGVHKEMEANPHYLGPEIEATLETRWWDRMSDVVYAEYFVTDVSPETIGFSHNSLKIHLYYLQELEKAKASGIWCQAFTFPI